MAMKRTASAMDESDDEDTPQFGRQILPVANLPSTFDGEPTDGLQYLFTVRREFNRLPHVTRVANPYELPSPPPPVQTDGPSQSRLSRLPSKEWRTTFESRFRNFRQTLSQLEEGAASQAGDVKLPEMRDRDKWWQFLKGAPESVWNPPKRPKVDKERRRQHQHDRPVDMLGPWTPVNPPATNAPEYTVASDPQTGLYEDIAYDNSRAPPRGGFAIPDPYAVPAAGTPAVETRAAGPELALHNWTPRKPTASLLKRIDASYATHLLMYMAYWIGLRLEHPEQDQDSPAGVNSQYKIRANHFCWIFALLARVEDGPSADDMAQMRSLARGCISLIKLAESTEQTAPPKEPHDTGPDNVNDPHDYVPSCWMIVACITGVWAQHDLWEEAEEAMSSSRT